MLNIYHELNSLIKRLNIGNIEYALCGGLAMAVYGVVRATADIDILILSDQLDKGLEIARASGFDVPALPMELAGGKIHIYRMSKIAPESGDILSLDFLVVTDSIRHVWKERRKFFLEDEPVTVVSKEGLTALKSLRGSGQDIEDIERLKGNK
jgi:hypothetical protein